jgi:hypothetical protein
MRQFWMVIAVGLAAFVLVGCGAGNGADEGGVDPNTTLIGIWQPISATRDGIATKVSEIMPDTSFVATRWQLDFRQDGSVTFTAYNAGLASEQAFDGTWSSDNQIAPVSIAGTDLKVAWSDFGNIMTASYSLDGHSVVAKWVRIVPAPTVFESGWIGTWKVQSVEVNGVATSLGAWFNWAGGSNGEQMELQSDGAAIFREMAGATAVNTKNEQWVTGNMVVNITYGGNTFWGYWEGVQLVFTILDPRTGDTVKMTWVH